MTIGFRILPRTDDRPDTIVSEFQELSTSGIADATLGLGVMDSTIRPISSGIKMAGIAFTVATRPADNLMVHKALEMIQPRDVLIIDAGGQTRNAILGGIITAICVKKGLGGIIVDGPVRDQQQIRDLGLAVFARGLSPAGPNKDGPGEINTSIQCGGVRVSPGDIIVGDDDGIVVVPLEEAERILSIAKQVEKEENDLYRDVVDGKIEVSRGLIPDKVQEILRDKGVVTDDRQDTC